MVNIVLEGEAAAVEHTRLLEEGREISVALRERSAQGKKRTYGLQFGMNGSTAWVFCHEEVECMQPQIVLEAVLIAEAAELFRGYLERIDLRQCLVDPSPLSPEMVEVSPRLDDFAADLRKQFAVEVDV